MLVGPVSGPLYDAGYFRQTLWVGLFMIVSMIWLYRLERRRWLRWLGAIALVAVIVQGVLGGLTVLLLLPWLFLLEWISHRHVQFHRHAPLETK